MIRRDRERSANREERRQQNEGRKEIWGRKTAEERKRRMGEMLRREVAAFGGHKFAREN